ncbi:MAG: endolytic transglycosylase MltG, partial [Thermaerobacterales bacterium]
IIDKLVRGEIVTYAFNVPEGLTIVQTMNLLDERGVAEAEALRAAVDRAAANWRYLPPEGEGHELTEPLEGYLFPSTYRIPRNTTPAEIVDIMLQGFEQAFRPEWRERAQELDMTIHEVMTLASIIESEAQLAAEREIISGVFYNRLRIGMKLDADPTVAYALGWLEGRGDRSLTLADLRFDSPYNTYEYPGLPPGPISNPGKAAIEAALYPAEVEYFFFVSTFDGTGAHVFARTYDEHLQNVRRYRDGR